MAEQPARRGLVVYIAVLTALAAGTAVLAERLDRRPPGAPHLAALLVLVPLLVVAEHLFVKFRFRDEVSSINLVEAVLAPLLFAWPGLLVVAAAGLAPAAVAVKRGNARVKAVFNVAQWMLAAGCGAIVIGLADPRPGASPGSIAAIAVALAVVGLVNHAAFAGVMTVVRGDRPFATLVELGPTLLVGWGVGWVVNALTGLLFVTAYAGHPASVLLFPLPLVVQHIAYRSYAGARTDRLRLAGLHRAAHALSAPFDAGEGTGAYLRQVAEAFEARGAALILVRGDRIEVAELRTDDAEERRATRTPGDGSFEATVLGLEEPVRIDAGHPLSGGLAEHGWRSALVAPLVDEDQHVGALVVLDQEGLEGFEQGELAVIEAFGRETAASLRKSELVAAIVADRERLAELVAAEAAHRAVVERLQEALTPPPPEVGGADLGVAFRASDPAAPTGGDLHSWHVLPTGELLLTVVDVLGHGVEATRDALTVISTLRILAMQGFPLGELIERADQVLASGDREVVATVVLALFDPRSRRLRVASGGHPPAIVVSPSGAVNQLAAPGCAIGWPGAGSLVVVDTELEDGDALVLYTDGLVEARKDILEGLDVLVGTAADAPPSLAAHELAEALLTRCLDGAARSDDSLVLVMRAGDVPAVERFSFPAEPGAVAEARARCGGWFRAQGVADDVVDEIRLIASELLSNGVRAGREAVTCELSVVGPWATIEVSDDGAGGVPDLDVVALAPPDAEGGRGLAIVRSLVDDLRVRRADERTAVRATRRTNPAPRLRQGMPSVVDLRTPGTDTDARR